MRSGIIERAGLIFDGSVIASRDGGIKGAGFIFGGRATGRSVVRCGVFKGGVSTTRLGVGSWCLLLLLLLLRRRRPLNINLIVRATRTTWSTLTQRAVTGQRHKEIAVLAQAKRVSALAKRAVRVGLTGCIEPV